MTAVAGSLPVELLKTNSATSDDVTLSLRRPTFAEPPATLRAAARGTPTEIDVSTLEDGLWELEATPSDSDKSDHTLVVVANRKPPLTLELQPDFPIDKPVTGSVNFVVKTSSPVPLTHAVVHLQKLSHGGAINLTLNNPGPEAKILWRSAREPDGVWAAWVTGHIGDLYSFETKPIHITATDRNVDPGRPDFFQLRDRPSRACTFRAPDNDRLVESRSEALGGESGWGRWHAAAYIQVLVNGSERREG
jgi:hypothetical protein